jgi:hypothetical protein
VVYDQDQTPPGNPFAAVVAKRRKVASQVTPRGCPWVPQMFPDSFGIQYIPGLFESAVIWLVSNNIFIF